MNRGAILKLIIACLIVLIHSSCTQHVTALDTVIERGELVVLTRTDPTTYIFDENGESGFEHALVTLFAKKLSVNVRFILPTDFKDILKITSEHEADFSAAGLSVTEKRKKTLLFTPPYYEVTQQLIYHQRLRRPKSISQIDSPFFDVLSGSSHAENLARLTVDHPQLTWDETNNSNNYELVSMVNEGLLDYTIADSNQFRIIQAQLHQLHVAFNLSDPEQIAWAFPMGEDRSLYDEAVSFINDLKQNGTLRQLQDQYFGFSKSLNYVGICTFRHHIKSRLPSLMPFFHKAAKTYELDWRLLAATAYQESHWNPQAVSPTGVRGVMMLTNATAKQLNINDRVDPAQSIQGGANYLSSRIDKIPQRILEPDRTWMALASYNVGLGHLEDARILTQQQGGDADKWADVKNYLPLLAKKEWYEKTKHGYARGYEPVKYVTNIRLYYDLLKRMELGKTPIAETVDSTSETLNIELPAL